MPFFYMKTLPSQDLRKSDLLDDQKVAGIAQTAITTHWMLLADN